ncbi:hypothetical protein VB620_12435 [Nodularia harveyana UHCC-0300]|uniref:Uncharacterized protein n=1 Tax=Nodularia harveyana UHCC-0300 TaxID=2974287 RepID=A0ABU5UF35_9CYAN|nr:hypothetical protein [Nodularia harveyana]MEA5582145.1 hypothetical protein [Nodularia harveyana UHCC-0300]
MYAFTLLISNYACMSGIGTYCSNVSWDRISVYVFIVPIVQSAIAACGKSRFSSKPINSNSR